MSQLLRLCKKYCADFPGGGNLHIVLDDGNLEDFHIKFCIKEAEKEEDKVGQKIGEMLLELTMKEREKLTEKVYND